MSNLQNIMLVSLFAGFILLEFALGKARGMNASRGDNILDMLCLALLAGFTQPFIFWLVQQAGLAWAPEYRNAWAGLPWYAMALILLVGDDMTQYWWHRASHSPLLWPLHRAHHSAQYMSARIIYRNNFFYYLAMPGLWISGALIYLGFADVYLVYIVIKLAVITESIHARTLSGKQLGAAASDLEAMGVATQALAELGLAVVAQGTVAGLAS